MKDSITPTNLDCVSHSLIEIPVQRGLTEWHVNFHYADGSVRKFDGTRWHLIEKSRKVKEWEETERLYEKMLSEGFSPDMPVIANRPPIFTY